MGLGKTVQVAVFLASMYRMNELMLPSIVVCPATVLSNWVRELHQWAPLLRVIVMHPSGSTMRGQKKKIINSATPKKNLKKVKDIYLMNV